jgi:HEAT repeat protein
MSQVQTLIRQFESDSPAEHSAAAEALARLGEDAQPAAVALVGALRTADAPTLDWCVAALEDLGPPLASQIDDLIRFVGDKSIDATYWAITLLGRAGKDASTAAAALTGILKSSPELTLRERAAWALGKIGPAAKMAVPALKEAAANGEPRLARLARQALGEIEL